MLFPVVPRIVKSKEFIKKKKKRREKEEKKEKKNNLTSPKLNKQKIP